MNHAKIFSFLKKNAFDLRKRTNKGFLFRDPPIQNGAGAPFWIGGSLNTYGTEVKKTLNSLHKKHEIDMCKNWLLV